MHLSQHKLCTRKMELAYSSWNLTRRSWRRTLTNGSVGMTKSWLRRTHRLIWKFKFVDRLFWESSIYCFADHEKPKHVESDIFIANWEKNINHRHVDCTSGRLINDYSNRVANPQFPVCVRHFESIAMHFAHKTSIIRSSITTSGEKTAEPVWFGRISKNSRTKRYTTNLRKPRQLIMRRCVRSIR